MQNTGLAGKPDEYFLSIVETELTKSWESYSYSEYLKSIIKKCSSPNGVFGAVLMWDQQNYLRKKILFGAPKHFRLRTSVLLNSLFPDVRYIWLRRKNKVRQAISLWKAMQTDHWNWRGEPVNNNEIITFNFEEIDHFVDKLHEWEIHWERYFQRAKITPLLVEYETHLDCNLLDTTKRVLNNLELKIPDNLKIKTTFRKMSDDFTDMFVSAYLDELKKRGSKKYLDELEEKS